MLANGYHGYNEEKAKESMMSENISINNEQMGKRIRELRESRGLTQDALSEILSVGANVIGCYERGEYGPSKKIMFQLCQYFDVSTDYLLYGETENVEDIMEQVDHFSDANKLKVLVRLMHYFVNGKTLTKEDKISRDGMKEVIDHLFEAEE